MVAAAGELTCGWGPGDGVAWWGTPDLEQMWSWVGRMDGGLFVFWERSHDRRDVLI